MKLKTDYKTLVIVGGWNKNIFNPDWVKQYLFPQDTFDIEIPLNLEGSARYSTKMIRVAIEQNKLVFFIRSNESDDYECIQELAMKIADYLPHTPVLSYGVNFLYEESLNTEKVATLLNCEYSKVLIKNVEKDIISTEIKYSFNYKYCILNLNVKHEKEIFHFDFNYHFGIKKLTDFKEAMSEHTILSLKDDSLEIMSKIYDLNIDEE